MFKTPILFIVFNRPEVTAKTLSAIRKVKPKYLFVAADGPREDMPDDIQKCKKVKQVVNELVDWDCELKTLYRKENRGCGHGPAEAITWFFEHVEQGIILEDDCLPAESFFPFCEELLKKYKNDNRVWLISGYNSLINWYPQKKSYHFSKMGGTWGWATWKRAWNYFDYESKQWFTQSGKNKVQNSLGRKEYYNVFEEKFNHYFKVVRRDVWDYQWLFIWHYHDGISIVPSVNLISNIGFGEDATHTLNTKLKTPKRFNIKFPLKHPEFKVAKIYDWLVFERFKNTKPKSFFKRVLIKAFKIMTRTNL